MHKHTFAEYLQALADTTVPEKEAHLCTQIARLLNEEGTDYPQAIRYAQEAVRLALPAQKGEASYQLARALFMQSEVARTQEAVREAIVFFEQNAQPQEVGKCYNMLGALHTNLQDFATALDFFEQAIAHNEATKNHEQLGRVFGHLAVFVRMAMPTKNILTFYNNLSEDALPARKAFIQHNMGIFYRQEQKDAQALEAFQNALSLLQDENIKYKLAETSYQIASLQDLKGESEVAFHFYLAALGQSVEEESPERIEIILYYLSHALEDLKGEDEDTADLRRHALMLIEKAENLGYKVAQSAETDPEDTENPDLAYPAQEEPAQNLDFTSRLAEVAQLQKSLSVEELAKRYAETKDAEIGLIWLKKLLSQYNQAWFGRKGKLETYQKAKAVFVQDLENQLQGTDLSSEERATLEKIKTELD